MFSRYEPCTTLISRRRVPPGVLHYMYVDTVAFAADVKFVQKCTDSTQNNGQKCVNIQEYRIYLSVYETAPPFAKFRLIMNKKANKQHVYSITDIFYVAKLLISPAPFKEFDIKSINYDEIFPDEIVIMAMVFVILTTVVSSPMLVLDIDVFDNSISGSFDSSIHKIQMSGFKYYFDGFDESKYCDPTLRDVFKGTLEYSFARIESHVPNYLLPENDFIISSMKFIPVNTSYIPGRNCNINSKNAIPMLPYSRSFGEIITNNKVLIIVTQRIQQVQYTYGNLTGDTITSKPYFYELNDPGAIDLVYRDYSFMTDDY
ncbi:hypothetical protein RF11_01382 [Thelohanellus kitauei]|uniref:Uncharacterized protein n=1 Tax=Thelohanellus kitauei TaxID=669202 RepID=A0A0C2NCZ1_THEKT|nr:hypothetical protein RF11_01382 [Thelohanellus kitauei]